MVPMAVSFDHGPNAKGLTELEKLFVLVGGIYKKRFPCLGTPDGEDVVFVLRQPCGPRSPSLANEESWAKLTTSKPRPYECCIAKTLNGRHTYHYEPSKPEHQIEKRLQVFLNISTSIRSRMMFISGASFLLLGCLACGANSETPAASLEEQASQAIGDASETQPDEEEQLAADQGESLAASLPGVGPD